MSLSVRNSLIVLLTILSIGCFTAHRYDLFQIELDLIAPENNTAIFPTNSENIEQSLLVSDQETVLDCKVKQLGVLNFCAFTILLSKTGEFIDYANGRNLAIYDRLDMDIGYSGPSENPNIRISFRNHDESYVKNGDYTSLKYNSMIFEPFYNSTLNTLSLSSFSVEDWWVTQHNVAAKDKNLDFSNIAYIEVLPNIISEVDDYTITVRKFTLVGELISESTLLIVILGLWSLVVMTLIIQNTNHLKHLAKTDVLTGAKNRLGLNEWADSHLGYFYGKSSLCMYYIDLDDFKRVNDIHGHDIGDELLRKFYQRLNDSINNYKNSQFNYLIARLAGDEFAVVFVNIPDVLIKPLAQEIIAATTRSIDLETCSLKISISIGISKTESKKNTTFHTLMKHADMAMYYAKKNGKNQLKIYDKSIARDTFYRKNISEKLKLTLNDDQFHLNFMPIYRCTDNKMVKAEVLLRSHGEHLKGIGPDVFIPIAEEFHLIHDIDLWVIEETFKLISQNTKFFSGNDFVFCINISANELHHEHFPRKFKELVEQYSIAVECIELEITETSLIDTNQKSITSLNELKALGVGLSLDDFGTGYTAFNQLIHYPVDCLKIDKSFVDGLSEHNKTKATMIKAMLSIAESYELDTVAEGVETKEQLDFLIENNCDMAQGYFLSKPLPFEEFVDVREQQLTRSASGRSGQ